MFSKLVEIYKRKKSWYDKLFEADYILPLFTKQIAGKVVFHTTIEHKIFGNITQIGLEDKSLHYALAEIPQDTLVGKTIELCEGYLPFVMNKSYNKKYKVDFSTRVLGYRIFGDSKTVLINNRKLITR